MVPITNNVAHQPPTKAHARPLPDHQLRERVGREQCDVRLGSGEGKKRTGAPRGGTFSADAGCEALRKNCVRGVLVACCSLVYCMVWVGQSLYRCVIGIGIRSSSGSNRAGKEQQNAKMPNIKNCDFCELACLLFIYLPCFKNFRWVGETQ